MVHWYLFPNIFMTFPSRKSWLPVSNSLFLSQNVSINEIIWIHKQSLLYRQIQNSTLHKKSWSSWLGRGKNRKKTRNMRLTALSFPNSGRESLFSCSGEKTMTLKSFTRSSHVKQNKTRSLRFHNHLSHPAPNLRLYLDFVQTYECKKKKEIKPNCRQGKQIY